MIEKVIIKKQQIQNKYSLAKNHVQSFYNLLHLTVFTGKVLDSYILDGDLF